MLTYCSFLSFSLSVIRCGDIIRRERIRKAPLHFENNVINSGKECFKLHFLTKSYIIRIKIFYTDKQPLADVLQNRILKNFAKPATLLQRDSNTIAFL